MTANIAIADSLKALDFNLPNREEPTTQPLRMKLFPQGGKFGNFQHQPGHWARSIAIDSRASGAGLPKTRKRGKLANDPAAIR